MKVILASGLLGLALILVGMRPGPWIVDHLELDLSPPAPPRRFVSNMILATARRVEPVRQRASRRLHPMVEKRQDPSRLGETVSPL